MNLFDIFEGAIDDLEARRIEDLNAKMDDFLARAKESNDPKYKEAMRHAYAKAKAERDSYYKLKVDEAPGAETLAHNERTAQSNLDAFDLEEDYADTNYTYTVFIDGTKEGTYGSKEEAKAVVRRKKEQAPGRDYRIAPKPRTSARSIKKFYNNKNRDVDESLKVSPHDAGMHAAIKGKSYDSNPHPKGSPEHLLWSKGHNAMRARKADLDEHGGGVNNNGSYIAWRKKANKEHGITKAPATVEEWKDSAPGEPDQDELIKVEGWQDFNKVEPYEVCLAGKSVKQFDYYEDARRFHDNWKKKLYNQGEKEKADKITLNPIMKEGSMAAAAHHPDGPKFGGYWKGTDPNPPKPGQGFGGLEELDNPMGDKELAYLIAKAKGMKSQPDPDLHKGDEHEINGDDQEVDEGIDGNMTVRSNPLSQPLRKSTHAPKSVMQSGAGKHANQLKKAAAARLGEMTDEEGAKLRKDAEEYAIKQMTAPKAPKKAEPKKSFMQQVGQKQIDMVKGAYKGLTGQLEESDNFLSWAVRNGYNITKPAIYESARKTFTEIKKGQKDSNGFSKCWPGKHEEGTKKGKNGGRVRNCVPNESVEEAANPAQQAAIAIAKKKAVDETAAWQKKSGKNKNGGLNKKGVDSYRKEHPGSKLQTAVTKKPSKIKKGSKDDKRRKSFCARMSGMKGPMKKPNGEPTRKALSLRKWHCESIENLDVMLAEAISEAKNLGNRVKIVKGPEAGQMGTIGEIRPGAFKGAPGYYTVDLDNGGHIQVRKEALRLIKDEVNESLRPGEYFVWTVYFDDGSSKRIKVTSDEFDPYAYYGKQGKVVVNVDYDWSIQGQ